MTGPRRYLVVHPTMNQNVRQLVVALAERSALDGFVTSLDLQGLARSRLLSAGIRHQLERRAAPAAAQHLVHQHPAYELRRLLSKRVPGMAPLLGNPGVHGLYARMDRIASRQVAASAHDGVIAYEDGALWTFQAAAGLGLRCVYDLPIPYWRAKHAVLEEEAQRNPDWAGLIGTARDEAAVLRRKDAELRLADVIVVASSFSRESLRSAELKPGAQIVQIPYGTPEAAARPNYSRGGRLRVLYVGSLTQRKGISYLFAAVQALGDTVELTVIGEKSQTGSIVLEQALQKHRHIPSMAHSDIVRVMRDQDVLVLPSLVEGFGLVLGEAMSQGLPILTTANTGGPDLLTEGGGWLVEPGSSAPIEEVLSKLASDVDLRNRMKDEALAASRTRPWKQYRERLGSALV